MDAFSKRILEIFKKEIECLEHPDCRNCSQRESCGLGGGTPYDSEYIEAYNAAIQKIEKLDKITEIIDDCDLEAWEVLEQVKEVVRA